MIHFFFLNGRITASEYNSEKDIIFEELTNSVIELFQELSLRFNSIQFNSNLLILNPQLWIIISTKQNYKNKTKQSKWYTNFHK